MSNTAPSKHPAKSSSSETHEFPPVGLANHLGNGSCYKPVSPEINRIEAPGSSRSPCPVLRGHLSSFHKDDLDRIFTRAEDYLREVTSLHFSHREQKYLMDDDIYVVSDSDLHGVVHFLHDALHRLQEVDTNNNILSTTFSRPTLILPSRVPWSMHPTAPMTVEPATTFYDHEAYFLPAGGEEGRYRPNQQNTITTIVSPNGVTEITWVDSKGSQPRAVVGLRGSVSNDPNGGYGAEPHRTDREDDIIPNSYSNSSLDDTAEPLLYRKHGIPVNDKTIMRKQRRVSMLVVTNGNKMDVKSGPGSGLGPGPQDSDYGPPIISKVRNGRVKLGQVLGSVADRGHGNVNCRSRSETSLFRMRAIFNGLEPPRLKQDAAAFMTMTDKQPILNFDYINPDTPGALVDTCSEDWRRHQCTQHESITRSSG